MPVDPTSAGMRTEYLSPLSGEIRIILPQADMKGTAAAKPPAYGSAHPLAGRYPDHVLVDIRPSGSSGHVDYIYEQLPTTPRLVEKTDPQMGLVIEYIYRDQLASTLPAHGATSLLGSALPTGRYVFRASENPIGGTLSEVTVITVLPPGNLRSTKMTDPTYGSVIKYDQFVLSSTPLPAIGSMYQGRVVLSSRVVDDDGTFSNIEVITSESTTGTSKAGNEIHQVFCDVKVVDQAVPVGTAFPQRGDFYNDGTSSGYVVDARIKNSDGVNATIEVTLSASNQASFTEYQLDNFTGDTFPVISTYSLGASQPSGQSVDSNGTYRETKRLGCNYWLSTTSKTTTFQSDSYEIIINHKWPSVLRSFRIDPIYRTGGTVVAKWMVDWDMKKEYIGPCRAVVTRVWTPGQPASEVPTLLIPESIVYEGIDLSFSIPACLHTTINVNETTGTNHPVYAYTVRSKTFNQTTYTDWPASIIAEVDVKPAFGGYLKEKMVVYAPE